MSFSAVGEGRMLRVTLGAAANYDAGMRAAAHMVGQMISRRIQVGIATGPHSGRLYGSHQASAPGEYPAHWHGQLISSIGYTVDSSRQFRVGSTGAHNRGFDYAVGLHEGTSKMAPRPYITKAVTENAAAITTTLGAVTWRKVLGG